MLAQEVALILLETKREQQRSPRMSGEIVSTKVKAEWIQRVCGRCM
jgi:hypothetical protein